MSEIIQTQFLKFHENIKLIDTNENQTLRDKRDILVGELRDYFIKKSDEDNAPQITFVAENQGSYSMGTGVKPLENEDYDIDVAILLNISKDDYTPVEVKKWIYKALDKYPRTVEYKKPCVRVQYHKSGEVAYHVDLACYSVINSNNKTYLSKGKPTSKSEEKFWEVSQPKELKSLINNRFSKTEEKQQFKRVIRYLKRWKDLKFKNSVDGKPTGIALTALAYDGFNPDITTDFFTGKTTVDDLNATLKLVKYILNQFDFFTGRLSVDLPVPPYNNLFEKMTDTQMSNFKEKLKVLRDKISEAKERPDPVEACKILARQFGNDFPIPEKQSTGQQRKAAMVGSTEQA